MLWLAVALGGALGSIARHAVNLEVLHHFERSAHHATFIVNVIGCLAIGLLAGRIAGGHFVFTPAVRTFVFVGVLGGFTTFSSFGLDTLTLANAGEYSRALLNVVGQLGLGLAGVWIGFHLGL